MGALIQNDLVLRRAGRDDEAQQQVLINERKRAQIETESKEGKCISCNSPISDTDEKCPNCGYKIHKYHLAKDKPAETEA